MKYICEKIETYYDMPITGLCFPSDAEYSSLVFVAQDDVSYNIYVRNVDFDEDYSCYEKDGELVETVDICEIFFPKNVF